MSSFPFLCVILLSFCFCDKITEIVRKVNKLRTTWRAKEIDRNYSYAMGTFIDNDSKYMLKERVFSEEELSISLPPSFDLRQIYPNCSSLKEIRDQSNCGSCWAFGAAEAISDRICIFSNQTLNVKISAADLVTCCEFCGFGCDGGWQGNAWRYWETDGVCTGGSKGENNTCKPYFLPDDGVNDYTPPCSDQCNPQYPKPYKEDKFFGKETYSVIGEEKMMREIYSRGSIEAAFTVFEDFETYKEGVYQYVTGEYLGGHSIKIIGWGEEGGVKYWICVNSWTEDWGDKGTFKMLRGENECGIEGGAFGGVPKL